MKFRDVEAEEVRVQVSDTSVTVELTAIRRRKNESPEALRTTLLTRVQAENRWKTNRFGKDKLPRFLRETLAELDALSRE